MDAETQLLPLVDQAYAAAADPQRWADFLQHFADAVGAPTAHLHSRVGVPERVVGFVVGREDRYIESYVDYYAERSPFVRASRSAPAGSVMTTLQLMAKNEFEQTEFFRDWEQPQGMYHGVLGVVDRDEVTGLSLLGAGRSESAGAFGECALGLIHALMPHVQRALDLNRKLAGADAVAHAKAALVDGLSMGVLVLDGAGVVTSINRAAERILGSGEELWLSSEGVPMARGASGTELDRLVRAALDPGSDADAARRREMEIPRPERAGSLQICVTRTPAAELFWGAHDWGGQDYARALLLVSDGAGHGERTAERLREIYGLTRAEAALCTLLLRGMDLRSAAGSRGIQVSTARSQLKQILSKTGTRRQAELLRRLLMHPFFSLEDPQ